MSAETDRPEPEGAVSMGEAAAAPPAGAPAAADSPTAASPAAEPQPTPTVPHTEQTASHPAGSAMPPGGVPFTERPEAKIGGAFAGGLVAALILKRLGR